MNIERALAAAAASRVCHEAKDHDGYATQRAIIREEWNTMLARYPLLFTGPNIGLGVGIGWWPALDTCFAAITEILKTNPGITFNAVQIKEKFGGLRFYYDIDGEGAIEGDDPILAIANAVAEAEKQASRTCEVCGQPGTLRGGHWMNTLCDEHAKAAS